MVEGTQDLEAQKVWISDMPPTVSRPTLHTSSTSYETPEEQRFLRKKVASSTRLSAIPSVVPCHANPRDRPGEPVGSRVSGYERESQLSSPSREADGSSERTMTTVPNGLNTQQLQVLLDTIAAGQRTTERLIDQLDTSRDPVHRAEPASRKFKPEEYSGAIDRNIES